MTNITITLTTDQYEILNECAKTNIMDRFLKDDTMNFPDNILYMPIKFHALEDARAINQGLFEEMLDSMTTADRNYYHNWRAEWSNIETEDDKEVEND